MVLCGFGWQTLAGQTKNPRRFQPWVLVKVFLDSTSANGIAYYDDYNRYNLLNVH